MKNIALILSLSLSTVACEKKGVPAVLPEPALSAAPATKAECALGGVEITYDGTVYAICNGAQGATGKQGNAGLNGEIGPTGSAGQNGYGLVFTTIPALATQCPTGGYVLLEAEDDAESGTWSCYDQGQHAATVCNGAVGDTGVPGQNGIDGKDATQTGFTIVAAIEPCGPNSSAYKEVLLCLADGTILADFSKTSGGVDTRLAFLTPGAYEDTDASACKFEVSADQDGGLTVTWAAQDGNTAGTADCQPTAAD